MEARRHYWVGFMYGHWVVIASDTIVPGSDGIVVSYHDSEVEAEKVANVYEAARDMVDGVRPTWAAIQELERRLREWHGG
jgi:hypothetical protein